MRRFSMSLHNIRVMKLQTCSQADVLDELVIVYHVYDLWGRSINKINN